MVVGRFDSLTQTNIEILKQKRARCEFPIDQYKFNSVCAIWLQFFHNERPVKTENRSILSLTFYIKSLSHIYHSVRSFLCCIYPNTGKKNGNFCSSLVSFSQRGSCIYDHFILINNTITWITLRGLLELFFYDISTL